MQPQEKGFTGTYFNGTSSHGHPAEVWLAPNELLLRVQMPDGSETPIRWAVTDIAPDVLDDPNHVALKYGKYPHQLVQVKDQPAFFEAVLEAYPQANLKKPQFHFVLNRGWRQIAIGTFVVMGIALAGYFLVGPEVAEWAAVRMPDEMDASLGEKAYTDMVAPLRKDSARTVAINEFFKTLKDVKQQNIQIDVIDDDEMVNAFALPGGHIVVYSGILRKMQGPEELAALLAHEYAHVEKRHTMRMLLRSTANFVFISIVFSDMNAVSTVLIENMHSLRTLSYNRALETEADARGLEILQANRIDPDGMVRLFQRLKDEHEGSEPPAILSTHPALEDRQAYVKDVIAKEGADIGYSETLKTIWTEKIVYTDSPTKQIKPDTGADNPAADSSGAE